MSTWNVERVLNVHHWTDRLFSFRLTRDPSFRFRSGQFTMVGLELDGKPLLRAYSMVSSPYDDTLEFLSIKVPNGPLTSRLQHVQEGSPLLVGRKPVGTLLPDHLLPGRNLFMLGTGTGLAPFMSLIRDPEVYDRFDRLVLVHGCRFVVDFAYGELIEKTLPKDELLGPMVSEKLLYYPTVTREPFRHNGRITQVVESGKLCVDLGLPMLDPEQDRIMLCGSPAFLADMDAFFRKNGIREGSSGEPGQYVIEKAFVEK